jgi:hypothetical protein
LVPEQQVVLTQVERLRPELNEGVPKEQLTEKYVRDDATVVLGTMD